MSNSRYRCFSLVIILGCVASSLRADENAIETYVSLIQAAQVDLDAGRLAEAKTKLGSTNQSQRGFEFAYLLARAHASVVDGRASDLIQTVAMPSGVEVRYGVLNPVNRQLVFICRDGGLRRYDLTALQNEPEIVSHPGGEAVWRGIFCDDGSLFFSGHQNGDVIVWDAKTWEPRHTIPLGGQPVREIATTADGSMLAVEGPTEMELWSLRAGEPKKVAGIGSRYNFGEGLAFSPQGDLVASGGMFDILLFDGATGEPKGTLSHASYTMGLLFSPDGKRIASAPRGNVNKFFAVFDIEQQRQLFNAGPFANYVAGMAFTPDGRRVAATGCEKLLRIFDAETGAVVLTLPRPECGAVPAISQDGQLLGWSEKEGFCFIDLTPTSG
jgi:WD40 repeat protein